MCGQVEWKIQQIKVKGRRTDATKRRTADDKIRALDSLCASESLLTDDPITARRQNISRCLTNNIDKGYTFFETLR